MAKKTNITQPLELDLFQLQAEYPEVILNNEFENNFEDLDLSKNVLICNVKKDNVEHFLDGTAKIYYTGKRFPSTIALNKLYYFIPYIGKQCDLDYYGIRDLYLIKVARVGSRREGELDNDPDDIRIVFELRFVRNLFEDYKPYKLKIWDTFADIKLQDILEPSRKMTRQSLDRLTYISLFSSAGVGCYGFKQNNFECIATNELLKDRIQVQVANNKCKYDTGYINGDITQQCIQDRLFAEIDMWKRQEGLQQVDVIFATPPCQGMSTANYKKAEDEQVRNSLVVQAISIIKKVQPKIFVLENVRAFMKTMCTDISGIEMSIEKSIMSNLENLYHIEYKIINFKDYGVPSSRPRTIVIGTHKSLHNLSPFNLFPIRREQITLRQAIGDLESLSYGEKSANDFLHFARLFPEHQIEWIHDLREGESAFDNPEDKQPYKLNAAGERVLLKGAYMGNKYRRLYWDKPCSCIATRNDQLASQDTIHPEDDRVLSIRELMRIMTIPQEFKWTELDTEITPQNSTAYLNRHELNIRRCIGEAVPTFIVYQIAANIRTMLEYDNFVENYQESYLSRYLRDKRLKCNFYIDTFLKEQQLDNAKETGSFYTPQCVVYDAIKKISVKDGDTIRILEPSVGLGAFLPQVVSLFSDKKDIFIDVVEIDQDVLEDLKKLLKKIELGANVKIKFIHHDFLTLPIHQKYDLVITNPPYGKSPIKYTNIAQNVKNLFAYFLIKIRNCADNIACVIPKNFLMADEFSAVRKQYEEFGITNISDFGVKFFKKVFVEIITINFSKGYLEKILVEDYVNGRTYEHKQGYIYHDKLWLIYRNRFFDDYIKKLKLGVFKSFRDRQITNSNVCEKGKIWVLRSKNILDDGTCVHISGYDRYIDNPEMYSVAKFLNKQCIIMPNFTYNIRAAILPPETLPNGSIAIFMPTENFEEQKLNISLYATESFREYYAIVKSYSRFTLNIDESSIYYIGQEV